jgi:hypothetical protein
MKENRDVIRAKAEIAIAQKMGVAVDKVIVNKANE